MGGARISEKLPGERVTTGGTAKVHNPSRRCVVSWRPRARDDDAVKVCVDTLKAKIDNEIADVEVDDTQLGGFDRRDLAGRRVDDYSDFICVLTTEYVQSCKHDDQHELVHWLLPQIDSDGSVIRAWALRLDSARPRDLGFNRHGSGRIQPWRSAKWHLMPAGDREYINLYAPNFDLDSTITDRCIERLQHTDPRCPSCAPAPQRPHGLFARLRDLFGQSRRNTA